MSVFWRVNVSTLALCFKSMLELLAQNHSKLEQLCQQFHVERLEVFGSATTATFTERSDLDFVVRFRHPAPESLFDLYFGLKEALETLFNRRVDLVMSGALRNPYFIESVNATRELLYAA